MPHERCRGCRRATDRASSIIHFCVFGKFGARADQRMSGSDATGLIARELRRELDECSCVQEVKPLRADILTKGQMRGM